MSMVVDRRSVSLGTPLLCVSILGLLEQCVADYAIFHQRYSADPAPMVHAGRLWIYTSHDNGEPGYTMTDYNALSSDDLVNWRDEGIVFSLDSLDWADYAWAQQVIQLPNNTFVMYYAAWCGESNPKCTTPGVGVAYADHPAGPFVDVLGKAIMPGNDPGVFIDPDDPDMRVLCSNVRPNQSPGNYGALCGRLAADMVTWLEPPQLLSSFNETTWRWYEAPWLYKIGSKYYMSYMMHGTDIGYSMSDFPMGNYTPMGALQWTPPYDCNNVNTSNNTQGYGPNNHQGMIEFPAGSGMYLFAYHNRKLQQDRNLSHQARNIALDRLYVNATDGTLHPVTSTPQWLRPLKYLDPFLQTPAFQMASCAQGINTQTCSDTPSPGAQALNIAYTAHDSYVHVRAVDFGPVGASSVDLRVATPYGSSEVIIQRGEWSTGGNREWRSFASCPVPMTGGWQNWTTVSCNLSMPLQGVVEDLRFVFACAACPSHAFGILNFAWWRFSMASEAIWQWSGPITPSNTKVVVALASRGASGGYVLCQGSSSGGLLTASGRSQHDVGARLLLVDNEDGSWRLQCEIEGMLMTACASETREKVELKPAYDMPMAQQCGNWRLQGISDGTYAFQSWLTRSWMVGNTSGMLAVTAQDFMLGPQGNERNVVDKSAHFDLHEIHWHAAAVSQFQI